MSFRMGRQIELRVSPRGNEQGSISSIRTDKSPNLPTFPVMVHGQISKNIALDAEIAMSRRDKAELSSSGGFDTRKYHLVRSGDDMM
mmetsp:Transcript_29564/g.71148  ORF Transcript_29564/g.71148 Transcript_29564/m.71148 type:complete len:87 (-) Transcript_29564:1283-1543(-)